MNRIKRKGILTISISWALIGLFMAFYDHFTLISHISSGPILDYNFIYLLLFHTGAGFSGGFIGSFVLIYVNDRYRSEPYYKGIAVIVFFYILITSAITIVTSTIPPTIESPLFSDQWHKLLRENLFTTFHLKNIFFWACIVAITYFFLQMSNKFGPGNLQKVLTGTYNIPRNEERIFMFLDLKSSTSIAEELGSEKYHSFLKEVFADITAPILQSEGDIYQYVGDEVVISWPMNEESNASKCIDCFFDIRDHLAQLREIYQGRFGAIPQFKAGAHCGSVIAGEIGIIKRDITYSGDILNTTARIQGQCNNLDSQLLISELLFKLIDTKEQWTFIQKDAIELKGKKEKLNLYAVTKLHEAW